MMKAYTDIEQSKKLAEILPLESADMLFQLGEDKYADNIRVPLTKEHWEQMMPDINPCWSLAALLDILNYPMLVREFCGRAKGKWFLSVHDPFEIYPVWEDEPIDACVEIICKLKEKDLL